MPIGDLLLRELERQLSVYLRLLDIPLPVTYGTSADEAAGA